MATIAGIWTGSGAAISSSTPFGIYDNDATFQTDGPKTAVWVCRRLGYPVMQIELTDIQLYSYFEEAVSEYGTQINNSNMTNWLLNYMGSPTGSANFTNRYPANTMDFMKRYTATIGSEIGAGGEVDWKTGSVDLVSSVQTYDVQALWGAVSESNARLEVKEIWHYSKAALEYSALTSTQHWITSEFGSEMGAAGGLPVYYMVPMYQDVLRAQAIELSDTIRKSNYSWEIINNKIRITPVPTSAGKMFFRYRLSTDPLISDDSSADASSYGVANPANIPYEFIEYKYINSMGKQWIRDYTLALTKESLGCIRSKYSEVPIPDGTVVLDGDALKAEGREDKQNLLESIRELLKETTIESMMESERHIAEHIQEQSSKIPLLPWIG